jgi:hypothetical protein
MAEIKRVPDGHKPGEPFLIRLTTQCIFKDIGGRVTYRFEAGDFVTATAWNERSGYWVASPGGFYGFEAEYYEPPNQETVEHKKAKGLKERIEKISQALNSYKSFKGQLNTMGGTPGRFAKHLDALEEYLTKDIAQLKKQLDECESRLKDKKEDNHDLARRSFEEAERRAAECAPAEA